MYTHIEAGMVAFLSRPCTMYMYTHEYRGRHGRFLDQTTPPSSSTRADHINVVMAPIINFILYDGYEHSQSCTYKYTYPYQSHSI